MLNFSATKITGNNDFYFSLNISQLNSELLNDYKFIKIIVQNANSFSDQFANDYLTDNKSSSLNFRSINDKFKNQINNDIIKNNLLFSVENKRNNSNKIFEFIKLNKNILNISINDSKILKNNFSESNCFIYFFDENKNIISENKINVDFNYLYSIAETKSANDYYTEKLSEYVNNFYLVYNTDNNLFLKNNNTIDKLSNSTLENISVILTYKNNIFKNTVISDINIQNIDVFLSESIINLLTSDLINQSNIYFDLKLKCTISNVLEKTNNKKKLSNITLKNSQIAKRNITNSLIQKDTNNISENNLIFNKKFEFNINDSLYKSILKDNKQNFIKYYVNQFISNLLITYDNEKNIYKITLNNSNLQNENIKFLIKSITHKGKLINQIYLSDIITEQNKFIYSLDELKTGINELYYLNPQGIRLNNLDDTSVKINFCLNSDIENFVEKNCIENKIQNSLFNNYNIIDNFNSKIKEKITFINDINLDFSLIKTFNRFSKIIIKNINDFETIAYDLNHINNNKGDIIKLFENTLVKISIQNIANNENIKKLKIFKMSEIFNLNLNNDFIEANETFITFLNNQNINMINNFNINDNDVLYLLSKNEFNLNQIVEINFYPVDKDILLNLNCGLDSLNNLGKNLSDNEKNILNYKFYNLFYFNKESVNLNYDVYNNIKTIYSNQNNKLLNIQYFYELLFKYSFDIIIKTGNKFIKNITYNNNNLVSKIIETKNNLNTNINYTKDEISFNENDLLLDLNINDENCFIENLLINYNFNNKEILLTSKNKILNIINNNISNSFSSLKNIHVKCILLPLMKNESELNENIYLNNSIINKSNIENNVFYIPSLNYIERNISNFSDFFIGYKQQLNNLNFDLNNKKISINTEYYEKNLFNVDYKLYSEFFNYCKTLNIKNFEGFCLRVLVNIDFENSKSINNAFGVVIKNENIILDINDLNKITFNYN